MSFDPMVIDSGPILLSMAFDVLKIIVATVIIAFLLRLLNQ